MTEIPLWLFESSTYLAASIAFAAVTLPLGYWVGYRDRTRLAFMQGYRTGRKTKVTGGPFDD